MIHSKNQLVVFLLVLCLSVTGLRAGQEWSDFDPEEDTWQLPPFEVNGNDPETFDWEGFYDYLDQAEDTSHADDFDVDWLYDLYTDTESVSNDTSPWETGWQWLTGTGPRTQYFRDGDPFTELLKTHKHIQDTREIIKNNIINNGNLSGENNYYLGGLQGVPKYLADYSTLITGGLTGNLAVTYLGSYRLDYNVTDVAWGPGIATVTFHVTNNSSINSATHPPVIGYTDWWNTYIGQPLNNFFSTGPMSQTTQDFTWTEQIYVGP